jgi:hypothetical protein
MGLRTVNGAVGHGAGRDAGTGGPGKHALLTVEGFRGRHEDERGRPQVIVGRLFGAHVG